MPTTSVASVRLVAPEIAEAYLSARSEFEKMSAEGIGKALQYFRETLKAPDFALGLAWHAACLFMPGYWGHAPTSEVYPTRSTWRCRLLPSTTASPGLI